MNVRMWSVAVLGTWLGFCAIGHGQEARPAGGYQPLTMAQAIARTMKESGQLSRYRVDVLR